MLSYPTAQGVWNHIGTESQKKKQDILKFSLKKHSDAREADYEMKAGDELKNRKIW